MNNTTIIKQINHLLQVHNIDNAAFRADLLSVLTDMKKKMFADKTSDETLFFDLWIDGRWVGMSMGRTVQEARDMLKDSGSFEKSIMTPYYPHGPSSDETYRAIFGDK